MKRDLLLYNLQNAIAYRGQLSQTHKDKWFKDPKARDYIMPRISPIFENDYQASELDRRRKLIKAIHEHEPGALESVLNQFIFDADFMIGRRLDEEKDRMIRKKEKEETEQMIGEIAAEQKQKAAHPEKLQYVKDGDAYNLATCDMVLRAGAGFFKVEVKDKTYKIVLRRSKKTLRPGHKEIPVREALVKLLPYGDRTIFEYITEAKKLPVIDIDDQAFIKKLEGFFLGKYDQDNPDSYKIDCKKAGITEFVFLQKEVTPTPQGILTYLLENIITISTAPTATAPVSVDFMLQDDLIWAEKYLAKFLPDGKFEQHTKAKKEDAWRWTKAQKEDAVRLVELCRQNLKKGRIS